MNITEERTNLNGETISQLNVLLDLADHLLPPLAILDEQGLHLGDLHLDAEPVDLTDLLGDGLEQSERGRARDPVVDQDDLHLLLTDLGDEDPQPVTGPGESHGAVVALTPVKLPGAPGIMVALPQPLGDLGHLLLPAGQSHPELDGRVRPGDGAAVELLQSQLWRLHGVQHLPSGQRLTVVSAVPYSQLLGSGSKEKFYLPWMEDASSVLSPSTSGGWFWMLPLSMETVPVVSISESGSNKLDN